MLTPEGILLTAKKGKKRVKVVKVKGLKKLRANVLVKGKNAGKVTVKRTGKVR